MRNLPEAALMKQLIRYDKESGLLFWRERPLHFFKSAKSMKAFNTQFAGKPAFRRTDPDGYTKGRALGVDLLAHRVIWAIHNDEWPSGEIDHIDGDPTNNRIENLRDVSSSVNGQNVRRSKRNSSGRTGVSFNKLQGKWVAYIQTGGKYTYLGQFTSFEAAVKAREKAETQLGFHENHDRI